MGIKELEHLKKSLLDIEGKKLLLIDLKIDYKESNLKINNLQNRIDGVSEFFKSENVMKRTKKLDKLNKRLEKAIRSVQDDISSSNLELKEESRKRVRGILIRILGILFLRICYS